MEEFLRALLARFLPDTGFRIHAFQGRSDLFRKLAPRLRAYKQWLPPDHRVIVVVDRDDDDCERLKQELERIAADAGLRTRSASGGEPWQVVNRIAIEELEAWYFGDWEAVCSAYPGVPHTVPARKNFRDPDAVPGGTWEAFERVLQKAGYFRTGLRKIEAAREIAAHLDPARSRSRSFGKLYAVLLETTASQAPDAKHAVASTSSSSSR